jgi:glycosyltransferase involved in cell wall biosynthesis
MIPPPRALVLSPSASHPQDYGNRNRVWQLTNFIKGLGYSIDFLLFPVEAEWNEIIPPEAKDMQAAWDSFWIIPPSPGHRFHSRARGEYHEIDEWWDESIGNHLKWLFSRRAYDLFFVNYTFLSKAFTFAPNTTTKILDTHDLFTGRKELLAKLGVEPEFFYTTEEQERIALERADIVIAIKDSEAEVLREWTSKEVVSIPFFPETKKQAPAQTPTGFNGLSIGFVGAGNSINSANLQAFLDVFDPLVRIYCPPLRLLIAGNVCQRLQVDNPAISLMGRVSNLDDFYSQVDVIVAPLAQSTGIKIKVGEALAHGKGVVSTANGYDGFPELDTMHGLRSMTEVSRALIELAFNPQRLERLNEQSRFSSRLARRATGMALEELAAKVRLRSLRIVMITDCPFWARGNLRARRLTQWAQICGFLTRTVSLYLDVPGVALAHEEFGGLPDVLPLQVPRLGSGAVVDPVGLADRIDAELRSLGVSQIMISVNQPWAGELAEQLTARGHAPLLDLWCPTLESAVRQARGYSSGCADFWIVDKAGDRLSQGELIEATALRFLPPELDCWQRLPRGERVLLISTTGEPFGYEADLSMAAAERNLKLSIVYDAPAADRAEAMFEALRRETDRPSLLLAASTDPRIQNLCASLATLTDVTFIDLHAHAFPRAVADERGRILLCESPREYFAELLRSAERDPLCFSVLKTDTGWSRLWQLIERRIRANQIDNPSEQKPVEQVSYSQLEEAHAPRTAPPAALRAEKFAHNGAIS